MSKRIVVIARAHDYHASLEGEAKWESGKSPDEAIGKLIVSRATDLGIEIIREPFVAYTSRPDYPWDDQ